MFINVKCVFGQKCVHHCFWPVYQSLMVSQTVTTSSRVEGELQAVRESRASEQQMTSKTNAPARGDMQQLETSQRYDGLKKPVLSKCLCGGREERRKGEQRGENECHLVRSGGGFGHYLPSTSFRVLPLFRRVRSPLLSLSFCLTPFLFISYFL